MYIESEFLDLIDEHSERTGFELPLMITYYLAQLLESRLENSLIIFEPSFADCYLTNNVNNLYVIKDFADQCLFFSSLQLNWKNDTNSNFITKYWTQVGQQSYIKYGNITQDLRFFQLADWFEPLQRFLASMVQSDLGEEMTNIYTFQLTTDSGN